MRPRVGQTTPRRRLAGMVVLAVAVSFGVLLSLAVGAKSMPWSTVIDAFVAFDPASTDHLIVRELRLARTLLAVLVGAALGAAGALMQGVTRNPLADPGLLGVNAGASFAVVLAIWSFGITSVTGLVWFAFIGAAIASVAVYVLGTAGRGGATPVRLALAGAALAALLFALTRAVTLLDQATLDQFRFWAVGSLAGRSDGVAGQVGVFIAVGVVLAMATARQLNALALGEEAARALGIRVNLTRATSVLAITLLCGSAVAAAGPIGFVGLVVPHVVRTWFGPDQRWLLPGSAVAGVALLLGCDEVRRKILNFDGRRRSHPQQAGTADQPVRWPRVPQTFRRSCFGTLILFTGSGTGFRPQRAHRMASTSMDRFWTVAQHS